MLLKKLRLIIVFVCLICITTFYACRNGQLKSISDFLISNDALANNDSVDIIYSVGGLKDNKNLDFYYYLIGVSETTKDTVNILVTSVKGLSENDNRRIFVSKSDPSYKYLVYILSGQEIKNQEQLNAINVKKIDKVLVNPDRKMLGYKKYKTIIGELMKRTTDSSNTSLDDGVLYQQRK